MVTLQEPVLTWMHVVGVLLRRGGGHSETRRAARRACCVCEARQSHCVHATPGVTRAVAQL